MENAGFKIASKHWLDKYLLLKEEKKNEHLDYVDDIYTTTYKSKGFAMVVFPEYDYEEEKSDIAIYVLSRNSGEGIDRRLIKGDALLNDSKIKDILFLNEKYRKFMLLLNVGGVVDLSPFKEFF